MSVDTVVRKRAAAATGALKSGLSRDPAKEEHDKTRTRCVREKSRDRITKLLADGSKTGNPDWGQ